MYRIFRYCVWTCPRLGHDWFWFLFQCFIFVFLETFYWCVSNYFLCFILRRLKLHGSNHTKCIQPGPCKKIVFYRLCFLKTEYRSKESIFLTISAILCLFSDSQNKKKLIISFCVPLVCGMNVVCRTNDCNINLCSSCSLHSWKKALLIEFYARGLAQARPKNIKPKEWRIQYQCKAYATCGSRAAPCARPPAWVNKPQTATKFIFLWKDGFRVEWLATHPTV